MEVQLSIGVAVVKDVFTRQLKKEVNNLMFEGVEIGTDRQAKGFTIKNKDKADDHAILNMVEKIVKEDGSSYNLTGESLDQMPNNDYEALLEMVSKVSSKKVPNA